MVTRVERVTTYSADGKKIIEKRMKLEQLSDNSFFCQLEENGWGILVSKIGNVYFEVLENYRYNITERYKTLLDNKEDLKEKMSQSPNRLYIEVFIKNGWIEEAEAMKERREKEREEDKRKEEEYLERKRVEAEEKKRKEAEEVEKRFEDLKQRVLEDRTISNDDMFFLINYLKIEVPIRTKGGINNSDFTITSETIHFFRKKIPNATAQRYFEIHNKIVEKIKGL